MGRFEETIYSFWPHVSLLRTVYLHYFKNTAHIYHQFILFSAHLRLVGRAADVVLESAIEGVFLFVHVRS